MKAQTLLITLLLSGCITQPSEQPSPDLGGADMATADLSMRDAGDTPDSALGDSGVDAGRDAGGTDAGGTDAGTPDMQTSWWNEEFQERVAIDFPADIEAEVPSFIAKITLDLSDPLLAKLTRDDVRFVVEDIELAHEFSEFGPGNRANAWVRLDQLSASKRVWLYFDNVTIPTSSENPDRVWGDSGVVSLHFSEQAMALNSAGGIELQCQGMCDAAQDGLVGSAFSPGDSGAYLETMMGDFADLHPSDGEQLTVSVWYKGGTPYRGVLLFSESNCVGWQVSINDFMSDGYIYGSFAPIAFMAPCGDSPNRYKVEDGALLDDNYHNVTWVVDRATDEATLYQDGVVAKTLPLPTTAEVTNTTPLLVGAATGGTRLFDGELDEVQVFNFPRSPEAVYAHYRNLTEPNYVTISHVD